MAIILPLILIALVFGTVLLTISLAKKTTFKLTLFNTKIIFLMFSGYVGILCVATILFFILPTDNLGYEEVELYMHDEENPYMDQDYYNAIDEGRFEDARGLALSEAWSIEYRGDSIRIQSTHDEYMNMRIMVERKDVNDGEIEMAYYTSRTIVDGFDITEEVGKHEFEFDDGTILITKPKQYELKLATFNSEFTTRQFTDEKLFRYYEHTVSMRGENIIHIKVPKDLEIVESETIYIQYLGII